MDPLESLNVFSSSLSEGRLSLAFGALSTFGRLGLISKEGSMTVSGSGRFVRSDGGSFPGVSDCGRLPLCFLFLLEGDIEGWGSARLGLPFAAKILSISDICDFGSGRRAGRAAVTSRRGRSSVCKP